MYPTLFPMKKNPEDSLNFCSHHSSLFIRCFTSFCWWGLWLVVKVLKVESKRTFDGYNTLQCYFSKFIELVHISIVWYCTNWFGVSFPLKSVVVWTLRFALRDYSDSVRLYFRFKWFTQWDNITKTECFRVFINVIRYINLVFVFIPDVNGYTIKVYCKRKESDSVVPTK